MGLVLQDPAATPRSMLHLWKVFPLLLFQILEASCLLLGLLVSLRLCSGKLMATVTDDVSKLPSLVRRLSRSFFVFNHIDQIWANNLCKLCCRSRTFPLIMRFPSAPSPKTWYVRALWCLAQLGGDGFEDAALYFFAGRQLLGGLKHLPLGAESSEAGRHVRHRLLQQGGNRRLHIVAEEPSLHLWPPGAGERGLEETGSTGGWCWN